MMRKCERKLPSSELGAQSLPGSQLGAQSLHVSEH